MKSKDITQDLLKGALDLHYSLEMFGKVQDKTKLKRKPKEKASNERSPDLFGYDRRNPEFNKNKFSAADGYSKDCYDELRDAIRDGLAKQNLLPKNFNENETHFDRTPKISDGKSSFDKTQKNSEEESCFDKTQKKTEEKSYFNRTKNKFEAKSYFYRTMSDLSMEFPSTSSDQSSMFHSREFDTSDSSFQWSFEEKDNKDINIISKHMGLLQDNPPKSSSSYNPQKQFVNDKSMLNGRPIYDVDDLLKPRLPYFSIQNLDSPKRSLEELTQNVQFKGLMTSPIHKQLSYCKKTDDSPPIVIIKPLHVITVSMDEDHHDKQKFLDLDLDTKEIIRKLKMKEPVSSRIKNVPTSGLDINELQRKLQGEMSLIKILSQENGDKYCIDATIGTGNRTINRMEKLSSSKLKAFDHENNKVQTKEVINEKGHNSQTLVTNTGRPEEGDIDKPSDARITRNINRISSISSSNPDIEPIDLQDQDSRAPNSSDAPVIAPQCTSTLKKKAKPKKLVSISVSTPLVETQLKNMAIQSNPCFEHEQDLLATKITALEEVLAVDQIKYTSRSLDYCNNTESNLTDFASTNRQKSEVMSTNNKSNDMIESNTRRNLLLGNQLFLNKVEELFYTNAYQSSTSRTNSSRDSRVSADDKLLLDCAKELLENKSLQSTGSAQRFSHALTNKTKNFIFLDQVVTEVCEGMKDLSSYRKRTGEKFAQDTLPKVLHKDLWCKGVVNGCWDMGWRCGFTSDEVEQIVVSIEHEILNGFIDDTLADVMC